MKCKGGRRAVGGSLWDTEIIPLARVGSHTEELYRQRHILVQPVTSGKRLNISEHYFFHLQKGSNTCLPMDNTCLSVDKSLWYMLRRNRKIEILTPECVRRGQFGNIFFCQFNKYRALRMCLELP